ncbi:Mitochondrial matrix cochaperone [Orbilia oligospora]|nr:Mitochondrial matrix cochaperone [Orbilia oligospora]KAF3267948.1 Mitochondrial matrix cochaperone [Orbilia oligospora]KAF3269678.1 Mitochondrial matrix cochaperone [Orbilia oligospora]
MLRRTLLTPARIRPFSSLTTSTATRTPSLSLSVQPSKLLQRSQAAPLQWRNATVLSRWSSTEASATEKSATATASAEGAKAEAKAGNGDAAAAAAAHAKELEAKAKEVADLKDKYLRSVADFRNLQDRTAREVKSAKDFAIQKFAKDLLESIDNLDRALIAQPGNTSTDPAADYKNLHDGLKMVETVLMGTLKRHGLERFDPIGEKFNPNMHEATFEAPMEGKEPGTVFHVQSKGFSLNGRVLRAAQVGVVKA